MSKLSSISIATERSEVPEVFDPTEKMKEIDSIQSLLNQKLDTLADRIENLVALHAATRKADQSRFGAEQTDEISVSSTTPALGILGSVTIKADEPNGTHCENATNPQV